GAAAAHGRGAGVVPPAVSASLRSPLSFLSPEPEGTSPTPPADPIQPENLKDLQRSVLDANADVGLAFDGDADRVFLVDDQAQPLSGSITTAILAKGILARHPGETIVHNLICSKVVPEVVREMGGTPVRTRVGHSFIKQVMAETGAIFGGEHSAHYYFRDNFRADSGLIASMMALEQLSLARQPLSELRRPFERYVDSGEINTRVDDPSAVIERVAGAYRGLQQDRLDGLTVDLGGWWFNLRPSNTEPLLRLNLEANDAASCEAHTAGVLALVRGEKRRFAPRHRTPVGRADEKGDGRGPGCQAARDPRLPGGQGPSPLLRGRELPLQPAPQAALRRARRHPHHAHRRGGDRGRRRARPAAEEGGGRG